MVIKKKVCAGFNGNEHEAYIYKNIGGKKYCKSCTQQLQPPKPIKKMTQKAVFKMIIKKELLIDDKRFYVEIWTKRFFKKNPQVKGTLLMKSKPICEICSDSLSHEPNLMYFHHILEKRNYPQYRHEEKNIAIVCPECHNMYETFPDKVPYLVKKKKELINFYKL